MNLLKKLTVLLIVMGIVLGYGLVTDNSFYINGATAPPASTPTPATYVLTVSVSSVTGNGSVYVNPPGTAVTTKMSFTYPAGTMVTLHANLLSTSGTKEFFYQWQGDLTGNQNPATITMNGNKSVTAVFLHGLSTPPPSLKLQFYNGNLSPIVNTIVMNFKIINPRQTTMNLSDVKVRYWYTSDGDVPQSLYIYYSPIGISNMTGSINKMINPKVGADHYAEIGFSSGAGSLAPGGSINIVAAIAKADWTNLIQTNDYSFNPTATTFVDWEKVTGYCLGGLVWGVEP